MSSDSTPRAGAKMFVALLSSSAARRIEPSRPTGSSAALYGPPALTTKQSERESPSRSSTSTKVSDWCTASITRRRSGHLHARPSWTRRARCVGGESRMPTGLM